MPFERSYHTIDIAKMVAAIFVVAIHSEPFVGTAKVIFIDFLARIAVPFFFLTSAFFFFKKPTEHQKPMDFAKRLAILYIFWFIVELPITVLHGFIEPTTSFLHNLLVFIRDFIFNSTFRGSWFIMSLLQGILLVWLLSKRIPTIGIIIIGIGCYLLVIASNVYVSVLPTWWTELVQTTKHYLGEIQISLMASLVFCALGKWVAEHEYELNRLGHHTVSAMLLGLLAAGAIEVFLTHHHLHPQIFESYLMLIPLTPCIFTWLLQHETHQERDYITCRRYSTIFFFSHFIFVFILVIINKHILPVHPLLKYALVLLACSLTAHLMLKLSRRKGFEWLKYGY